MIRRQLDEVADVICDALTAARQEWDIPDFCADDRTIRIIHVGDEGDQCLTVLITLAPDPSADKRRRPLEGGP